MLDDYGSTCSHDKGRGGGGGGGSNSFWGRILIWGAISKTGQIVNNKIFLRMLGTIPNHEYEYESVFYFYYSS